MDFVTKEQDVALDLWVEESAAAVAADCTLSSAGTAGSAGTASTPFGCGSTAGCSSTASTKC